MIKRRSTTLVRLLKVLLILAGVTQVHAEFIVTVPLNTDPVSTEKVWHVISQAYQNLGIEITRLDVPLIRVYQTVNQGTADAAMAGLPAQVEPRFPLLLKLPTPVFTTHYNAYGLDSSRVINSWEDLTHERVVTIRGYNTVSKALPEEHIIWVNDATQVVEMVLHRRVEIAVGLEYQMQSLFHTQPDKQLIQLNPQPLFSFSTFHYLHPKHAALVAPLDHELSEVLKAYRKTMQAKPQ